MEIDKKLSQLPIKNTPSGTEYIHILDVLDLTDGPTGTDKRTLIPASAGSNIGNITMVTIFDTIIEARNYMQTYTTAIISDESFSKGIYKFSVPRNSIIIDGFMSSVSVVSEWHDHLGFFTIYGTNCFSENSHNFLVNIGDNITFRPNCFYNNATSFTAKIGIITSANDLFFNDSIAVFQHEIKNILSLTGNCFQNMTGRLKITGNNGIIGTTAGQDFNPDTFATSSNLILILPTETETINAGAPDGDIQLAITAGATVRYIL